MIAFSHPSNKWDEHGLSDLLPPDYMFPFIFHASQAFQTETQHFIFTSVFILFHKFFVIFKMKILKKYLFFDKLLLQSYPHKLYVQLNGSSQKLQSMFLKVYLARCMRYRRHILNIFVFTILWQEAWQSPYAFKFMYSEIHVLK